MTTSMTATTCDPDSPAPALEGRFRSGAALEPWRRLGSHAVDDGGCRDGVEQVDRRGVTSSRTRWSASVPGRAVTAVRRRPSRVRRCRVTLASDNPLRTTRCWSLARCGDGPRRSSRPRRTDRSGRAARLSAGPRRGHQRAGHRHLVALTPDGVRGRRARRSSSTKTRLCAAIRSLGPDVGAARSRGHRTRPGAAGGWPVGRSWRCCVPVTGRW